MLHADCAISKRTDFYLEGIYQGVHGAPKNSVLSHAIINTLSPLSTNVQLRSPQGFVTYSGVWHILRRCFSRAFRR